MSSAAQTLTQLAKGSSAGRARVLVKSDDDVVIVAAKRSAITKGRKGGFKDTLPEELLSGVLRSTLSHSRVPPHLIGDIAVGTVLPPGGFATPARMAALAAGIPHTVPINTVNRQCSSGLHAVVQIANEIKAGMIDIGIGAGVESMTSGYGPGSVASKLSERVLENKEAEDCLIPMGITSENVAEQYHISREAQDAFAARSFQKASEAQKKGYFTEEIVPLQAKFTNPSTSEETTIIVSSDDGIRAGVTAASLAKLKPAFKPDGSTHAGNASQVSDGAAVVVLARRSVARKLGLDVLGKYVCASVVGVPPRIMGVGPAYAIPPALSLASLSLSDIDFFEINEAFASQALMSIHHLGIQEEKVNPNGGAIALGHPLGCTGARQIATALSHAKRTGEKVFVTSMCIGSGMGMAAVFVNEQ